MKTLYLDTEFNGHGGQLLSLALVSKCGREFYKVFPAPARIDPWVAKNVMPKMGQPPEDPHAIQQELFAFLRQFGSVMVIADWYADFVHFFSLFEGDDFSSSFDIPVRTILLAGPSDVKPGMPHNALSDARALRDYWDGRIA